MSILGHRDEEVAEPLPPRVEIDGGQVFNALVEPSNSRGSNFVFKFDKVLSGAPAFEQPKRLGHAE